MEPPPPPKKKGSIDGTPKILMRLTLGSQRWPRPKIPKKNENGIFGISASRGLTKYITCHVFGWWGGIDHFQWSKKFSAPLAPEFIITD